MNTTPTQRPLTHGQIRILGNLAVGAPLLEGVTGRDCRGTGTISASVSELIRRGLLVRRGATWRLTPAGKSFHDAMKGGPQA